MIWIPAFAGMSGDFADFGRVRHYLEDGLTAS
jgi:hypothetical protein